MKMQMDKNIALLVAGLLVCVGCGRNTKKQETTNVQQMQTICQSEATHSSEASAEVDTCAEDKGHIEESEVAEDSLTHSSEAPAEFDFDPYIDIYAEDIKYIKELEVANDSLLCLITSSVNNHIAALLAEEKRLTDSLIASKVKFLIQHWDNGDGPRDFSAPGYLDVVAELRTARNANLQDLLGAISTGGYNPKRQYPNIPNAQFTTAYESLHKNVCDLHQRPYPENFKGDSIKARKLLQKEKLVWEELLSTRAQISKQLGGNQKMAFDNGSRRLQWNQLLQLKNEYKNYGLIDDEVWYRCLPDTCSYEVLLNYPDYTTVWNDFYKRFYHSGEDL